VTKPPAEFLRATKRLGARVATLRREHGLTQDQLAAITGISRNQIQNIENNRNNSRDPKTGKFGVANPGLETIFRLAKALDVDAVDLIGKG